MYIQNLTSDVLSWNENEIWWVVFFRLKFSWEIVVLLIMIFSMGDFTIC